MKKKTSLVISLFFILGVFLFMSPIEGKAATITGKWGTSSWSFDDSTGEFSIGAGTLTEHYFSPWSRNTVNNKINHTLITKITLTGRVVAPANSNHLFSVETKLSESIFMSSLTSIEGLENLDTSNVTSMEGMFSKAPLIKELDVTSFDTRKVTNMRQLFYGNNMLEKVDVSNFNTSKVTNFSEMFSNCYVLEEINLSEFDTGSATTMASMFAAARTVSNLDISNFNTSKVTDMSRMFNGARRLKSLDLSNFDTSNVTDMSLMFSYAQSLTELDLTSFDTSKVTYMQSMFSETPLLTKLDVSTFDTSNVIDMTAMFSRTGLPSLDITHFNTSSVTSMASMFAASQAFKSLDITNFDTSKVVNMKFMFGQTAMETIDLSNFNTSMVTDFEMIFYDTAFKELDLNSFTFNASQKVTDMFTDSLQLSSLTLNESFATISAAGLGSSTGLSSIDTTSGEYNGRWIGTSGGNQGVTFASSTAFMDEFTAAAAGTYVWEKTHTLVVKDLSIPLYSSWKPEDNFVSGTDGLGNALSYNQLTVQGTVDTNTLGTYQIIYHYGDVTETATVKVVTIASKLNVEFINQEDNSPLYKTETIETEISEVLDLTDNTAYGIVQILEELKASGYELTGRPPNEKTYVVSATEETVKYFFKGTVQIITAPETINFGDISFSGQDIRVNNPTILGDSLEIRDTRSQTAAATWRLKAKVTQEMQREGDTNILANALHYQSGTTDISLTAAEQIIYTKDNGGTQNISANWRKDGDGVKLSVAGMDAAKVGSYVGEITWVLEAS